jgi:hypothetical protein
MRFGVHLGPFWVSFGGRRRRRPSRTQRATAERRALDRQRRAEKAELERLGRMSIEEYARYLGLSEDQVARVKRIAEARPGGISAEDWHQADEELRRLKDQMGGQEQD